MRNKVTIKVIGDKKVARMLKGKPLRIRLAADRALHSGALMVEGEAKKRCPVDTGRLRASITTAKESLLSYIVGTNVEYGPYVEYGTTKMRAQPFLRPAAMAKREAIFRNLKNAVKRATKTT